jgi:hypothetical protein
MRMRTRAVLGAALLAAGVAAAAEGDRSGTDLTGTWRILATIPKQAPVCGQATDCVYPALATATRDGTILQTAPISNTLTGHGSWKRTGPREFRAYTIYFRVDPATGAFVGTSETTIEVTVARGGRTADGSFTAVILDAAGTKLTDYAGTVVADRVDVP